MNLELNKQLYIDTVYPVGSIYMSINSTSPATLFGGTWERIVGKFLIGAAPEGTDWSSLGLSHSSGGYWYYNVNGTRYRVDVSQTGGEAGHTLTVGEMPSHNHQRDIEDKIVRADGSSIQGGAWTPSKVDSGNITSSMSTLTVTRNTGGGSAHNNLPPYLAVFIWKRIA